jgi:hypothetical protein
MPCTTRSPIVATSVTTIATQFIRESVPQLCNSLLLICRDEVEKKFGLTRHDSAHDPIGFRNWCQIVSNGADCAGFSDSTDL